MTTDKDKQTPAISIVMPAYNAEMYIREAIDSVICQSFPDFECIVVDDGSTDGTRDIIRAYHDKRIVLLENKHDFIASLNLGMDAARGRYIARMDADDIMHLTDSKFSMPLWNLSQALLSAAHGYNILEKDYFPEVYPEV